MEVNYDKDTEEDPLRKAFWDQFGTNGPDKYQYRHKLYAMHQGTDTCSEFVEKVLQPETSINVKVAKYLTRLSSRKPRP